MQAEKRVSSSACPAPNKGRVQWKIANEKNNNPSRNRMVKY